MFKMKRIVALMLVCAMVLTMVACGSDDKGGKTSVDVSKVETIYDAIKLATEYTQGEYEGKIEANVTMPDRSAQIKAEMNGKKNGEDGTGNFGVTLKVDDAKLSFGLDNAYTVAGGKLYLDIDAVLKNLLDVDTEFGNFAITMPKADQKKLDSYKKDCMDLVADMLKSMIGDIKVEKDGNTFTVKFNDAKDLKNAAIGLLKFMDKNEDKIGKLLKDSSDIYDIKQWLLDVIDEYTEDVVDVAKQFGADISKSDIKEVKNMIKDLDFDEATEEIDDLFEDIDFEDAIKELEDIDDDEFEEAFKMFDKFEISFSVTAEKEKYEVESSFKVEGQGVKINLSSEMTFTGKDVTITAPKKVSKISDMVDYVMNDEDVLTDIMKAAQKKVEELQEAGKEWSSLGGDIIDIPDTDEPDWTWGDDDTDEPDWTWGDDDTDEPDETDETETEDPWDFGPDDTDADDTDADVALKDVKVNYDTDAEKATVTIGNAKYELEYDGDVLTPMEELNTMVYFTAESEDGDQEGVVITFAGGQSYDTVEKSMFIAYDGQDGYKVESISLNDLDAVVVEESTAEGDSYVVVVDIPTEDGTYAIISIVAADYDEALDLAAAAIVSFE